MGNTTIQTQSFRAVDAEQSKSKRYIIPFALLCSLFFLWAVANNLNDILLPQFQQAFTLTNFQAGLIQSAFYFGYFVIPIPPDRHDGVLLYRPFHRDLAYQPLRAA